MFTKTKEHNKKFNHHIANHWYLISLFQYERVTFSLEFTVNKIKVFIKNVLRKNYLKDKKHLKPPLLAVYFLLLG